MSKSKNNKALNAKNMIASLPFHERLAVVAKSIKFTPGKHLTLEQDVKTNVWWLCGAAEGDQAFSVTRNCKNMYEALDHIEKWFQTNTDRIEEKKSYMD